jgi:phosphatidylserine/phosphatidylglycerophosphate/cardiolipin synthase-like enzyme
MREGHNCWRIVRADRASVVVDAEAYYRAAREAMLNAKHQILLVGWDFDARIDLILDDDDPHADAPQTVGALVTWLVKRRPDLNVYVLRWDKGAIKTLFRGMTLVTLSRWRFLMPRIHLKLDGSHPTGASQHQKIAVIDDCIAFCGGIDMTEHRWDTREHRDRDPRRRGAWGFMYKPWHDATSAVMGPAARALGELCRARWAFAGGAPIDPPPPTEGCWPDSLTPDFTDRDVAISRTEPQYEADGRSQHKVLEVEHLYLDLIARGRRHIYIESQYFASRKIAEAIAARLAEEHGPEIVIINPVKAQGFIEPLAMDSARARLMRALKLVDPHDRLRMYHPVTARGKPIYVHAKIMVVDDKVVRVGSSNFNNRSLRLDTECDLTIDADLAGEAPASARILAIRDELLAEHLGVSPVDVSARIAETGSLIAAIESLRGTGKTLAPFKPPRLGRFRTFLAEKEVLDPESPEEMFEPLDKRPGLLSGLGRRYRQMRRDVRTRRRRFYGRR